MDTTSAKLAWLRARQNGIGGSDAGSILGHNPYRGPYAVYMEKIAVDPIDTEPSNPAYWGSTLEHVVAEEFQRRMGFDVIKNNDIVWASTPSWQFATLDYRVREEDGTLSLLECKTANFRLLPIWQEGIPILYYDQVQHYLAVTGYDHAWVACLVGGQEFVVHNVKRDEDFIHHLTRVEQEFWQRVKDRDPPPVDGTPETGHHLAHLYPKGEETTADIPLKQFSELTVRLHTTKRMIAQLETDKAAVENEIKAIMGNASVLTVDGETPVATWKTITRKGVDTARFKKEHPDLAKEYMTETEYRALRIFNGHEPEPE